ncbi:MAG: 16S rRNA (adenine(1518)-N(6)/adenine(1519)-N(6))-dimethyltransferase RsmA [Defluviitaleaceae bacterium]|nr:16S rRNA (adenine(1518)-N(6)/adenine(1519)-N(6))-dimethyltransferase RsmA [Defluviitaleaceae bacterium]
MTELNLATASGIKAVMARYEISQAKKKLGQHFLIDQFVLEKIVTAAEIGAGDFVLEIGPGIGGMTQALLNRGASVLAVELDKQLVPVLRELFLGEQFEVVQGDILRLDLRELLNAKNVKVVANLPYYITTPVIFHCLESGIKFQSITVMVQKEVARRMSASPSTKDYGSLSLAVQYYADVELVANVPSNCFMPRPNVDSAVVKLLLLPTPRVAVPQDALFKVIHAAFGKRRKTLINALDSEGIGGGKAALAEVLEKLGLDPRTRGETLDLGQFARLAKEMSYE